MNNNVEKAPMPILLVEDNPDHAELVMRGFQDHQVANRIYHVSDGAAALDFLFRRGSYADPVKSPRPRMILLDLRLPKVDGLKVLEEIRASDDLGIIPVVILTTSEADSEVIGAYSNCANSYLVKPVDFDKFNQLMEDLAYYWLFWNYCPQG